jgi:enoyl-CoA hydratase/carnithine racemase
MLAAVNGASVGFGATLQLHCDVAMACSRASLQFPFIDIGIVPEASSSVLLERFVGPRLAADLLLTGRRLDAREAFEVGLFSRITEEDVLQATMRLANSIVRRPADGVYGTVKLLRASRRVAALEALDREMSLLNPLIPGLIERLARNNTKPPDKEAT